jgi:hypothetical protein
MLAPETYKGYEPHVSKRTDGHRALTTHATLRPSSYSFVPGNLKKRRRGTRAPNSRAQLPYPVRCVAAFYECPSKQLQKTNRKKIDAIKGNSIEDVAGQMPERSARKFSRLAAFVAT